MATSRLSGVVLLLALLIAAASASAGVEAGGRWSKRHHHGAPPPPPPLSPCATVRCAANYTCCPSAAQAGQGPCVENTAFLFDNQNCGGCGTFCGVPPGMVGILRFCTNGVCGLG